MPYGIAACRYVGITVSTDVCRTSLKFNFKLLKGNTMNTQTIKLVTALTLATLSCGALASSYDGECTREPQSKWLKTDDVKTKIEAQGYSVGKVNSNGSCYEVYAKDMVGM